MKTLNLLLILCIFSFSAMSQFIDDGIIEKPVTLPQWNGPSNTTSTIYRTGNVGIGTSSPTQKLDINGNIRLSGGNRSVGTYSDHDLHFSTNSQIRMSIKNTGSVFIPGDHRGGQIILGKNIINGDDYVRIYYAKGFNHSYFDFGGNLHFRSLTNGINNGTPLVLQSDGNVVIGGGNCYSTCSDQAHGYKLAVKGKMIAEEVVVKLHENWPDYVFQPNYKLRTLEDVEAHINTHGHLPEVPNAQTIEEKGISVGQMNALLLKKVEELTLYVIEQQKRIEELENR